MTKNETTKVLAMLSAFYGNGKANATVMAEAWHVILRDYEYRDAEAAVMNFAKNDCREYAAFPPPGKIVELIKHEQNKYNRLLNSIHKGIPYDDLVDELKVLCNPDMYKRGVDMDPEELLSKREEFIEYIKRKQLQLQEVSE
jgi:hypothetical protein